MALLEFFICFLLTAIAPIILVFIFFCFGEAIYYECKYIDEKKEKKGQRDQIVARQSARMSLEMPLVNQNPSRRST